MAGASIKSSSLIKKAHRFPVEFQCALLKMEFEDLACNNNLNTRIEKSKYRVLFF